MAVKCNTPNLALKNLQSLIYGLACGDNSCKVAETYLEYLNCPTVDHHYCEDYVCDAIDQDVVCNIDNVNLTLGAVTISTASATFTAPSQPYTVVLTRQPSGAVVDTKNSPTSPVSYTGLLDNTDYRITLTMNCPGGEVKQELVNLHTLPACVQVTDVVGVAEEIPEEL